MRPDTTDHAAENGEVVLVVDDEPSVRSFIANTLRASGYFVLEADDGESALAVLNDYHGPAHLLVADLMMPVLGGAPLIQMLHDWYPGLKTILVSGYGVAAEEARHTMLPGTMFLAKPFNAAMLRRAARAVLDA